MDESVMSFREKVAAAVRDSEEPWFVSFALWAAAIWWFIIAYAVFA